MASNKKGCKKSDSFDMGYQMAVDTSDFFLEVHAECSIDKATALSAAALHFASLALALDAEGGADVDLRFNSFVEELRKELLTHKKFYRV